MKTVKTLQFRTTSETTFGKMPVSWVPSDKTDAVFCLYVNGRGLKVVNSSQPQATACNLHNVDSTKKQSNLHEGFIAGCAAADSARAVRPVCCCADVSTV